MNLFETFKFFHYLLHNFEGSWFESSIHRMIINTEANANCRTVINPPVCCYLEDSNQEPSVWKYTKRYKKIKIYIMIRTGVTAMLPLSFQIILQLKQD